MADTCKCNSEDKIPPNQLRFFRNCWFGNSDAITKSYTQIFKNLKKVVDENSKKTTTNELAQNVNYTKESMMSIGKKKYALKKYDEFTLRYLLAAFGEVLDQILLICQKA